MHLACGLASRAACGVKGAVRPACSQRGRRNGDRLRQPCLQSVALTRPQLRPVRLSARIRAQQQNEQQHQQQAAKQPVLPGASLGDSSADAAPAAAVAADDSQDPEFALILIACCIGVATGAGIVLFNVVIHVIRDAIWQQDAGGMSAALTAGQAMRLMGGAGASAEAEVWPKVVFPPLVGGLAVGALGALIGGYEDKPGSTGSSSSSKGGGALAASWQERFQAVVRPVSRAVAATITLGTGASLGPEGPSVDIGRSVAQGLGTSLRNKQSHLVSLLAAGSGAGVAAGFNAPISGVFFAVETVIQKQQQMQLMKLARANGSGGADAAADGALPREDSGGLVVAMVLLASVLAAVVSQAGLGSSPAFRVPAYRLESIVELPLYLGFGALCGIVSASFSFSMRVTSDAFDELRAQNEVEAALLPMVGGLTTGILALGAPEILYQGFDNVNSILSSSGEYAPGLLVQIVMLKVIATSICRGSGLQGGLYAPSIFIGAALGSAFGQMVHVVGDPIGLVLSAPQAYALVGVAAMLASNCAVPLTSVLLLFELTRDYLIILPTLAAVGISFWVSSLAAPTIKRAVASRRVSSADAAGLLVSSGAAGGRGGSGGPAAAATSAALADGGLAAANNPTAAALVGSAAAEAASLQRAEGVLPMLLPATGDEASALAIAAAAAGTRLQPALLAAAAAAAGRPVSVALAMEESCLVVGAEAGVELVLSQMEDGDQHVAVVVGQDGAVLGVVSRDVLQECVAAVGSAAVAAAPAEWASSSNGFGSGENASNGGAAASGSDKETQLVVDIIDRA